MAALPLQVIDNFLIQYHVGHALVLAFVFALLGALTQKSLQLVALTLLVFGLVFAATPASAIGEQASLYRMAGIALTVLGPVVFVSARR
jgi:type IV secretory pathway VirB6-like protein